MNWKVSIVIPCWNGRAALEKSLPETLKMKGIFEWILVDDGSTDGSAEWVESNFPKVMVIKKKNNEGFPVTANMGVERSKGDLVAIINHDLIPKVDTVVNALAHFQDKDVFGVTFNETAEQGWGVAQWKSGWIEISAAGGSTKEAHETFWGSGGETIYRKEMWRILGGYDEIFSPGYWEDLDIGYRARKRGWKLIWEPEAVLVSEDRGESFGRRWNGRTLLRIKERNRLLLIWKNVLSEKLLLSHFWGVLRRVVVHPGYLSVVLAAVGRLGDVVQRRKLERKEAKLSDEEVFKRFEGV